MKTSTLWVSVLWLACACLPSNEALDGTSRDFQVASLTVTDARGGRWPPEGIPRAPRFEFELEGASKLPESRIWLLAGTLDKNLVDDLLLPPLRQSTLWRLAKLVFPLEGAVVAPAAPLTKGARYTLAVLEAPERLWSKEFTVSPSPAAGAALAESLPAHQARGVPRNLSSILLRFDGYLRAEGFRTILEVNGKPQAAQTTLQRCQKFALGAGDCLSVQPQTVLPADARAVLTLTGVEATTGTRLAPIAIEFQTAGVYDERAPSLTGLRCALDERPLAGGGCVLEQDHALALRLSATEPVIATLTTEHQARAVLSFGTSVEFGLDSLAPGQALPSSLTLVDLAGHQRVLTLGLATTEPLSPISIDEVRADPLGPEPAQDVVELLNFGHEPVQIMSFSLSDDAFESGVTIDDDLSVLPGERVLVVGPNFDPRDTTDGALSPGIRFARTGKALALANGGTRLFLRDRQGRRLSAAPRIKPERAGACVARAVADRSTGTENSFANDPTAGCTLGRETHW